MKSKIHLILWLLCITQTNADAQNFAERQFQFFFDNTLKGWLPINDSVRYGYGFQENGGNIFLIKWDARHDSMVWQKTDFHISENVFDLALLPLPDGGAVLTAAIHPCDVGPPLFICRIDALGEVIWQHFGLGCSDFGQKIMLFSVYQQPQQFDIFIRNCRIRMDVGGNIVAQQNLPVTWNNVIPDGQGEYLLTDQLAVHRTQPFGNFASFSVPTTPFDLLPQPNGNWLMLDKNSVYRLDADFQPIQKISLGNEFLLKSFQQTPSNLFILGHHNSKGEAILVFDVQNFNISNTFFNENSHQIQQLFADPADPSGKVWLSGNLKTVAGLNQRIFLAKVSANSALIQPTRSLELTNVWVEQPARKSPSVYFCNFSVPTASKLHFGKIRATLKNVGTSPIEKWRVNGSFPACDGFFCPSPWQNFTQHFQQTLLPDESIEVLLTDTLTVDFLHPSSTYTLCFWAALPDDRLDDNWLDDRACTQVPVVVATDEAQTPLFRLKIMPHPVSDATVFSLGKMEGSGRLSIFDATGRAVFQQNWSGESMVWQRGNLPAGVYFYQLLLEKQPGDGAVLTGKLMLN